VVPPRLWTSVIGCSSISDDEVMARAGRLCGRIRRAEDRGNQGLVLTIARDRAIDLVASTNAMPRAAPATSCSRSSQHSARSHAAANEQSVACGSAWTVCDAIES
jgi:hypothetical protein